MKIFYPILLSFFLTFLSFSEKIAQENLDNYIIDKAELMAQITLLDSVNSKVNNVKKKALNANDDGWEQLRDKKFKEARITLQTAYDHLLLYIEEYLEMKPIKQRLNGKPDLLTKPKLLLNLAHSYLFTGDYDKALKIYTENKSLSIDPVSDWQSDIDDVSWEKMILIDFKIFKAIGINNPNLDKAIKEYLEFINVAADEVSFISNVNYGSRHVNYHYDKKHNYFFETIKIGGQTWMTEPLLMMRDIDDSTNRRWNGNSSSKTIISEIEELLSPEDKGNWITAKQFGFSPYRLNNLRYYYDNRNYSIDTSKTSPKIKLLEPKFPPRIFDSGFFENISMALKDRIDTVRGAARFSYYDAMETCPQGFHIPSDNEWKQMEKEMGIPENQLDNLENQSDRTLTNYWDFSKEEPRGIGSEWNPTVTADVRLKEKLLTGNHTDLLIGDFITPGWLIKYLFRLQNNGITNNGAPLGFTVGTMGQYWTSTKTDMFNVIGRTVTNNSNSIYRSKIIHDRQVNCLCVKDRPLISIISESKKLQEITEKIQLEEGNGNNYFNRAIEFFLLGENMYAIQDLNRALEIDNDDIDCMLFKAQLLFIQNFQKHNKEINELVETYLSKETNNPFAWRFSAMLKLYTWNNSNKLAITSDKIKKGEALANINKAVKLDPSNIEYLKLKSDLQSSGSDYSNAIATLKKALVYDSKNPDLLISMAMNKLRYYHQYNTKNNVRADKWCTLIGSCYKITPSQISKVCNYFKKAINYGGKVSPDYYSLCSQLKQAKLAEQHKPIIHTGPRGGRYTMSKSGNKVYIPRNK